MMKQPLIAQKGVSRPPRGMAATEYLLATTALTSAWFMLYSSPAGLGRALIDLLSSYSFSLSLPW